MPTKYQCKACKQVFEGHAPVYLNGATSVVYPDCPTALVAIKKIHGNILAMHDFDNYDASRKQVAQIEAAHVVGLQVTEPAKPAPTLPSPALPGAWGSKTLSLRPETPEEAKKREAERAVAAIQRKEQEKEAHLAHEAQKLVNRMEAEFARMCGNKSAKFPKDWEYGTTASGKPVKASAAVIKLASALWLAKGRNYSYRPPKFKQVWGVKMANFEKLIVAGDASQGKHNYHVTV